jgi:hypothetical protein
MHLQHAFQVWANVRTCFQPAEHRLRITSHEEHCRGQSLRTACHMTGGNVILCSAQAMAGGWHATMHWRLPVTVAGQDSVRVHPLELHQQKQGGRTFYLSLLNNFETD